MGFSFAKPSRHLLSQKKDISDLALGPVPYITDIEKKTDQKAAERRSENARAAAAVRHEENAALKQEALAHYEMHKHQYNSVQDAARKIADKIVPVKSRTVARWISANNKNQLGA